MQVGKVFQKAYLTFLTQKKNLLKTLPPCIRQHFMHLYERCLSSWPNQSRVRHLCRLCVFFYCSVLMYGSFMTCVLFRKKHPIVVKSKLAEEKIFYLKKQSPGWFDSFSSLYILWVILLVI